MPDPFPLEGNHRLYPSSSMSYSLRAWNAHSEHAEGFEVRVYPPAGLEVWTVPADPLPGDDVTLHWAGENLTSLHISDELGNPILTASPAQMESGSIPLGVLAQGIYRYDFQAAGHIPRDQIERRH